MVGNSRRSQQPSSSSSTFQISNPNLPSHSQQIFSVTNIFSKGLNFIFCVRSCFKVRKRSKKCYDGGAAAISKKRSFYGILRPQPPGYITPKSIYHSVRSWARQQHNNQVIELLGAPQKRIKKEEKKKLSAEGWTFLRYFLPPSAKMLNGL